MKLLKVFFVFSMLALWTFPVFARGVNQCKNDEDRIVGTVKWFNKTKGFGFISSEGRVDIFAHFSRICGNGFKILEEDERVSFIPVKSTRGEIAEGIVRLEE